MAAISIVIQDSSMPSATRAILGWSTEERGSSRSPLWLVSRDPTIMRESIGLLVRQGQSKPTVFGDSSRSPICRFSVVLLLAEVLEYGLFGEVELGHLSSKA